MMAKDGPEKVPLEVLRRFHDSARRDVDDLNYQRLAQFVDKPFTDLKLPATSTGLSTPTNGSHAQQAWVNGTHIMCTDASSVPELAGELGPKSRFGDGDGSFWDVWLNTTGVKTTKGYVSSALPPLTHKKNIPHSGFKRVFMPVTKKDPPILMQAHPRRTFTKKQSTRKSLPATPNHKFSTFMASRASTLSTLCTDDGSIPDEHGGDVIGTCYAAATQGQVTELTPKYRANYFGDEARSFFFDTYQQALRQKEQLLDFASVQASYAASKSTDEHDDTRPPSSRTRFVGNCVAHDLLPRACLVIRRNVTTELKLQHQGIGDEVAILLAKSLADLPFLTKIDLRCNRLTDKGLQPLLEGLAANMAVREINIGGNKLGQQALDCLAYTLSNSKCVWKALSVPQMKMTDEQCNSLVTALRHNTDLTELDLCNNFLGSDVYVSRECIGVSAIARVLESAKCRIQKLDLSWNFIRLGPAEELMASIRTNCSLTSLDLSHNKLAGAPAFQLANSLRYNHHLNTLYICSTGIGSRTAFSLAVALDKNRTMRYVDLKGNPIGPRIVQELAELSRRSGGRLKTLMSQPGDQVDGAACWFDPTSSRGGYLLDLADPYQYAVATYMLRLAAEEQVVLSDCAVIRNQVRSVLDLVPMHQVVPVHTLESNQLLKDGAVDMAMWYFDKYDRDGSGSIDEPELKALLEDVGAMDISDANWILCVYDIDGSGSIERSEFLEFFAQLVQQLKTMTVQAHFMGIAATNREYFLDYEGFLEIAIQDNESRENMPINSAQLMSTALSSTKSGNDRVEMIEAALARLKLGANQAHRLFQILMGEVQSKVAAMAKILPRLITPVEGRRFVERSQTTPEERSDLRKALGGAHDILVGLLTGHHRLDLSNPLDRIAMERLLEVDEAHRATMQKQKVGDTSQGRTFSGFRNTIADLKRVTIEKLFSASNFPHSGIVEFDYVYLRPPSTAAVPLSDSRFYKAMMLLHLADANEREHFLSHVMENARCFRVPWEPSSEHATAVANHFQALKTTPIPNQPIVKRLPLAQASHVPTPDEQTPRQRKRVLSIDVASAIDRNAIEQSADRAAGGYAHWEEFAFAAAYLFTSRWLYCYQVQILLQRAGTIIRSENMSTRVELLVRLFTSILDVVNFHQILAVLSPEEHAILLHRIGYLNVWNPIYPDGYIELDLSDAEQKQVARMLFHLSVAEDGENILDQSMRPTHNTRPFTSWRMPVEWFEEKSWPNSGIIKMKYFSGAQQLLAMSQLRKEPFAQQPQLLFTVGAGEGLAGCEPDAATREGLMSLVYANVLEELISVEVPICSAEPQNEMQQRAVEEKWTKRTMQPHWLLGMYRVGTLSVSQNQPCIADSTTLAEEQGLNLCY